MNFIYTKGKEQRYKCHRIQFLLKHVLVQSWRFFFYFLWNKLL
uniref:Uncharacterized protein n=1 Tax=Lepeophtheirus salmonis TaxID=72036 RepID=A0A0K2UJ30_LEPSM